MGARVRAPRPDARGHVCVGVSVERPPPPAQEQPDGERDDHHPDHSLGCLLDRLGQVGGEEDDRETECEECAVEGPGERVPYGRD